MLGGQTVLAAPTSGQRRPRILFFSRSVLFEHPPPLAQRAEAALQQAQRTIQRKQPS